MFDLLSARSSENRARVLGLAGLMVAVIAAVDWWHPSYISLGFLYLFPIMILGTVLSWLPIVGTALLCAGLQEALGDLPSHEAAVRFILSTTGFSGTGLFVSESIRSRVLAARHVRQLEEQIQLRHDAEEQIHALIESSPAAILTIGSNGRILLANEAAQRLFAPGDAPLTGQRIGDYLPSLQSVVDATSSRVFRTTLQGKATRRNGEVFLAAVWFSTYATSNGSHVAAIVVDLSEDLRSREDLSLDQMLRHTRIVMSAIAHEIRNISSAVLVAHRNLSRMKALEGNDDFIALGTLIEGLEKLTEEELRPAATGGPATLDLSSILDDLRVVAEPGLAEHGIASSWPAPSDLPVVFADRHGLMQVFLNLVRNSERAMEASEVRHLRVAVSQDGSRVAVRFVDSGVGVPHPEQLFRPRWDARGQTGLGLYVSRAIMRSVGGDLVCEPVDRGASFVVSVRAVAPAGGREDG